jgi:hypothetical protein
MTDELEVAAESAKAVQESAKLGGKLVDAGSDLGSFVSRVIGGPLDQVSGIVTDKLAFIRLTNRLRFQQQYAQLEASVIREVQPSLAIPMLQSGMFEDDHELQDLWVAMLANAADPAEPVARRSFIALLQQLDPFDLKILERIYFQITPPETPIYTAELPSKAQFGSGSGDADLPIPEEVELSLRNLTRVGIVESGTFWGGTNTVSIVNQTALGWAFIRACTRGSSPAV